MRGWGAVRIRYPIFQVVRSHRVLFILLSGIFALALLYAVLWAFNIPQNMLGIEPITGVPDNLFSTIIEVFALLFLGTALLLWKTISTSENTRIDNTKSEVPDLLIVPISPNATVEISFDSIKHYSCPPILEACLRWIELDREELFLVEAGSLDIPKLTLCSAKFDRESETLCLELGSSSFFDIFYTHYSPDLALSSQSPTDKPHDTLSLRTLFDTSIFKYYKQQIEQWKKGKHLCCSNLLPNPLGISGVVILSTLTSAYVLLRKRGSHEIAARNRLEWSFAGLVEATSWIHTSKIDFFEFVEFELHDEVLSKKTLLNLIEPKIEPIGFVFNPLYLFQPEIFVVVKYHGITDEKIAQVKDSLTREFLLVPTEQISLEFQKYELKNLCIPGLKLLHSAYPTLFDKLPKNFSCT